MATVNPGVSIGALLRRPEILGLPLELAGGAEGLDRRITSPHIQKTGLALAGFDAYLSPGRVLIFGESEIRYLESLPSSSRVDAIRRTLAHDIPCVLITGGFAPAARAGRSRPTARASRCWSTPVVTPLAIAKVDRDPRGLAGRANDGPRGPDGHPRARASSSSARAASARASARSTWSCAATAWSPTTPSRCAAAPRAC